LLEDGGRQITDFIVPGDLCSGETALQDWGIGTLSQCTVAYLPHDRLAEAMEEHPRIALALWRLARMQAAILREWTVNIGRRPADKRVAHVLCELCLRLEAFEARTTAGFVLPLSQIDLADATALSSVHINRVLGRLRDRRLLSLQRRSIIVKDLKRIMAYAQFNDSYLQPELLGD
jgi:CRP-like cAMP-binding protein